MRKTAPFLIALIFAGVMSHPARSQTGQPHPADAALAHATAFQATMFGYPLQGMYQRLTEEVLTPLAREPLTWSCLSMAPEKRHSMAPGRRPLWNA